MRPALLAALLGAAASPDPEASQLRLPAPQPAAETQRWPGSRRALEQAALSWERAAREGRPEALAHLYRLTNLELLLEEPRRVDAALARALASPRLDPLARAHAAFAHSQALRRAGRLDEARAQLRALGYADAALLIGPFDGAAGQGHGEVFGPELELAGALGREARALELLASHPGKSRAVSWREVRDLGATGGFELSSLVSPAEEVTVYLALVVRAERALTAAIRIGAADQLKVFLDGWPLAEVDARRAAALEQQSVGVRLPAGDSLLLVKSSWLSGPNRVSVRLSTLEGGPLEGAQLLGDRESVRAWRRRVGPAPQRLPHAAVDTALDRPLRLARGSARAELLALRADLSAVLSLADQRRLPSPAERDLASAIELAPGAPDLRFFFAHRAEPRDPNLAREQLEAALTSDPGHVPSLYKLGEMARQGGRLLEAEARLAQALALDPRFTPARVALAQLWADSPVDRERALALLAEGEETPALLLERARQARSLDDRPAALQDLERVLAREPADLSARTARIGLFLDGQQGALAGEELNRLLTFAPWELDAWLDSARLTAAAPAGYPGALALLAQAAALFPDSAQVPKLEAELLLFSGDRAGAAAALSRSLALDPHQPLVRRHRGELLGLRQELEDEFGLDVPALIQRPVEPEERSWGAISLAERTAVRLYENGESSRFYEIALRLRRQSLRDALRVQRIAYVPSREIVDLLAAERVRENGEILKASSVLDEGSGGKVGGMYLDRRTKVVTFDDLAEGDVVHLKYRIDSTGTNIFGGFFGDIEGLQGPLPKRDVRYVAIAPRSRPLYPAVLRAPAPTAASDALTTRLEWSFPVLEAIDFEAAGPPYPELGTLVSVSTYKSWDDLGRWYAGLFAEQLELDDAARAAGRQAVAGVADPAERIRRLYAYVVRNTRYVGIELGIHGWKPFKAAEVHRRRYGDCKDKATLLAALLTDNGIDATIALVRTADRGHLPEDHATMWAFNHAITYVPSADLFLDATAEFSGSRELPYLDQGAQVLIVERDGRTRWRTLPESRPEENLNVSSYEARLGRDGALELRGHERYFGARAAQAREEFDEAESRRSRLERQLNQTFEGVHVEALEFSDLSRLEEPVEYRYRARIDRYGTDEGGRTSLPVALFQHQVALTYAATAERKSALFTNHAWSTQNVVRYTLPPGAVIEELPQGVALDSPYLSLAQVVRAVPGGFESDDTVTLKARRIPASAYAELRQAALAVDRALARRVVIRW